MAQQPPDQNFYHTTHSQFQLPTQFRNPFDLLFDERSGAINYNYIRPYMQSQVQQPGETKINFETGLSDSLVARRPRRTRTTFTSLQIAELEQNFIENKYITSPRLVELSAKLGLGTAQVKIWFKNRRRRHKIQSSLQADSSTDFSLNGQSPVVKLEPFSNNITSGPLNLQTHSMGSSGRSTPKTLTPSPTPTSTPNPAQSYTDYNEAFNSFYYGHLQAVRNHSVQAKNHALYAHSHGHINASQYASSSVAMQSASNPINFYTPSHASLHNQQQMQYHHMPLNNNYYSPYPHFQIQHRLQAQEQAKNIYGETDHVRTANYCRYQESNPKKLMGNDSVKNDESTIKFESDSNVNKEEYEPLTPKTDESPVSCLGVSVASGDPMHSRVSGELKNNENENNKEHRSEDSNAVQPSMCSSSNSNEQYSKATEDFGQNHIGSFPKFHKRVNQPYEVNYQCTMDTIKEVNNSHRNPTHSTQFAFCFN